MFSLECAGRPVHHQICAGCLHISLLSSGPAFFIYIETRSSLEHRWTHNNMIFLPLLSPLIVCSYPGFVVYSDYFLSNFHIMFTNKQLSIESWCFLNITFKWKCVFVFREYCGQQKKGTTEHNVMKELCKPNIMVMLLFVCFSGHLIPRHTLFLAFLDKFY